MTDNEIAANIVGNDGDRGGHLCCLAAQAIGNPARASYATRLRAGVAEAMRDADLPGDVEGVVELLLADARMIRACVERRRA